MNKRLRNIFDQYSQQENHLTNSLLLVLNHNRKLLRSILNAYDISLSGKRLNLISQIAPKKIEEKTSIPDGYIYTEDYGFCIGIETKIKPNSLIESQLQGHIDQLRQYDKSYLIVITPDEKEPCEISKLKRGYRNIRFLPWQSILKMMSDNGADKGKNPIGNFMFDEFVNYMERHYHMTPFTGFKFRDGYDTDLAAHYIKRITEILTPEMIKKYPDCKNTRPKITGTWQAWFPDTPHQNYVHLTCAVSINQVRCVVILGNGCKNGWKKLGSTFKDSKMKNRFKTAIKKGYIRISQQVKTL